jgi:Ca-activated chloride channel family protein
MRSFSIIGIVFLLALGSVFAQSRRVPNYSESGDAPKKKEEKAETRTKAESPPILHQTDEVIRVDTDLVFIPTRITDRLGNSISDIRREEFKIYENGVEQEIAYFSNENQPFTVALVLDMSYSSVFKLPEIQSAALAFVNQLRENDRVMVVSFDEKARILCEPTDNRKILRLAIEGAKIASGTSLYSTLSLVLSVKMHQVSGRKAVVLLSDAVDTSSSQTSAADVLREATETDVLIYPIQYDTYDDVQKSRKESAQIFYDENDRPYTVEKPRVKGEREEDYRLAKDFAEELANQTGGRVYRVSTTTNLTRAFANIAEELRKIYSLGYYPSGERKSGARYSLKVRVYRPDLIIRARSNYVLAKSPSPDR